MGVFGIILYTVVHQILSISGTVIRKNLFNLCLTGDKSMKYISIWGVCVLVLAVTAFSVYARPAKRYDATTGTCRILNDGPLEWESRSWGEGGKTFKQFCKSCHTRDNTQGGTFLWEESKTSQGWNNIFAQKRAQCAKDGVWDELSSDRLLMVNDFLYRWASNSLGRNDAA